MSERSIWREYLMPILGFPGLIALAFLIEHALLEPAAQRRSPEQVLAYWKQHADDHPGFAPSQVRLALAYQAVKDWDGAAQAYARALELEPNSELYAVGRSGALRAAKRDAEAAAQMESFLAAHPECVVCSYNLAASYFALGRIVEARRAIDRFLAHGDYRAPAHYGQQDVQLDALLLAGRIYEAQGLPTQARQLFERALAHAPRSPEAWFQAGRLRAFASPDAALDYWARYRALAPADARGSIFAARALIDARRYAEAIAVLAEARSQLPRSEEGESWRLEIDLAFALARFRQGDLDGARRALEELLARHPELDRARDLLAEVEQARAARS